MGGGRDTEDHHMDTCGVWKMWDGEEKGIFKRIAVIWVSIPFVAFEKCKKRT